MYRYNHCIQVRVFVHRILWSYVLWHLHHASDLLMLVFALLCFLYFFSLFLFVSFVFPQLLFFFFSQLYQLSTNSTYESWYDPHIYDHSPTYRSYIKTRTWLYRIQWNLKMELVSIYHLKFDRVILSIIDKYINNDHSYNIYTVYKIICNKS